MPERKVTKPELGHLKKAGAPAVRHLREFKVCCAIGTAGRGGSVCWIGRWRCVAVTGGGRLQAQCHRRHAVTITQPQLKDKNTVTSYAPGQQLKVEEVFKEGDVIDIAGTTIGKGFQGAYCV